eukprot:CAMPEP_0194284766 /NCGR_PEP_ID=MMETSP0169-20130528/28503_1 /TAXON_ID=218684 /ORGANISM="Corethron pennatum, Strain L29A3" /LENGTH=366 /DNA_ID=CAMNT_0039030681 /DNA_START=183 /DNA_END=1283 /DNA_ORIENTATION=-
MTEEILIPSSTADSQNDSNGVIRQKYTDIFSDGINNESGKDIPNPVNTDLSETLSKKNLIISTVNDKQTRDTTSAGVGHRIEDDCEQSLSPSRRKVGVSGSTTFPAKLHKIVSDDQLIEIVRFLGDGRKWIVVNKTRFEEEVLPLYFRHNNYLSFTRSVVGWGFQRAGKATYYHELFVRDSPDLCLQMSRKNMSKNYSTGASEAQNLQHQTVRNDVIPLRNHVADANNSILEHMLLNSASYPAPRISRPYDTMNIPLGLPHVMSAPMPDRMEPNNDVRYGTNFPPQMSYQRPDQSPSMSHFNYRGFSTPSFPQLYQDHFVHAQSPNSSMYVPPQDHHNMVSPSSTQPPGNHVQRSSMQSRNGTNNM